MAGPTGAPALDRLPTGDYAGPAPGAPDLAELVRLSPMRRLISLVCDGCAYEWVAPSVGACPRCHGRATPYTTRVSAIRIV